MYYVCKYKVSEAILQWKKREFERCVWQDIRSSVKVVPAGLELLTTGGSWTDLPYRSLMLLQDVQDLYLRRLLYVLTVDSSISLIIDGNRIYNMKLFFLFIWFKKRFM